MIILYSVLLMAVLGLVFGIFLAFSAKKFAVKEDPRIALVTAALPGINCGACGYPGCAGYAKAIIKDNAHTDRCVPGKKMGVSDKINELLKNNK